MAANPTEIAGPGDGELLEAVRSGSSEAYATLYERHVAAAHNMARQVARSPAEADDLVADAFAKVLDALRGGRGPTSAFRAYLLTSVRNAAYDRTRRESKVRPAEDVAEVPGADVSVPFVDPAVAGLERSLAAQAFAALPERWQTVLWHIEVEGQTPAEVAPLLGLTPNGVSALAYRARERLRQAYLQVHLGSLDEQDGPESCRAIADRLGAWTRHGLSKRETAQVEAHLDNCDRCRALAAELTDVNGALRVFIAPLLLGTAATGYLAATSTGAVAGAGAGAAGAAAGAGGSAVGAASAGPRQGAMAGISTTALVAAVAVGLSAGPGQVPTAAPPPPPPPAEQPAPQPQPPPPEPPEPEQPAPAPAPAPPPEPELDATSPARPIELVPGGDPVDLPITVRNGGSGPSEPVSTTISVPPGVTARIPGAGGSPGAEPASTAPASAAPASTAPASTAPASTAPASTAPASTAPASTAPASTAPASTSPRAAAGAATAAGPGEPGVECSSSTGSITCSTDRGLQPGESFTFQFQLRASPEASSGNVEAAVDAGERVQLALPVVPVRVQAPADGVQVRASAWDPVPWLNSRVEFDVRNTGRTSGRAEADVQLPAGVAAIGIPHECDLLPAEPDRLHCSADLEPDESFTGRVWVGHVPGFLRPLQTRPEQDLARSPDVPVEISARLGEATDSDVVDVGVWFPWVPPLPDLPEPDQPEPTEPDLPEPPTRTPDPTAEPDEPEGTTAPPSSAEVPTSTEEPDAAEESDRPEHPSWSGAPSSTDSTPPADRPFEHGDDTPGTAPWGDDPDPNRGDPEPDDDEPTTEPGADRDEQVSGGRDTGPDRTAQR